MTVNMVNNVKFDMYINIKYYKYYKHIEYRMRISFRLIADKLFGKKNNILVGRWNIDYDNVIQERKVYLTNMDHCGCCGNIHNNKNIQNKET